MEFDLSSTFPSLQSLHILSSAGNDLVLYLSFQFGSRSCELSLNFVNSFLCFCFFRMSKYFSKPVTVLNFLYVLSFFPYSHSFKRSNKLLLKLVINLDLISFFDK